MSTPEEEEPILVQVVATCHTEDCQNADVPIQVQVVEGPDPYVVCGPCGQRITDLTPSATPKQEEQ